MQMSNQPNTSTNEPRTVQDIIRIIETKSVDGGYIYRGERREHTKVSSKLYREYEIENEYFGIEIVEQEMLTAAKKHTGYRPKDFQTDLETLLNVPGVDPDETIDFEILTEIQHYGGKTNLIDFSTDYLIALFFACDGHPDKDGQVILQKVEKIKEMIAYPRNPRHRVIAQKSVFVRPPKGFIELHEDDIVTIPASLKRPLLERLRKYHDVSTETIYNDLHGFIKNQDIHRSAHVEFHTGFAYQSRAGKAATLAEKQKELKKAIEHYDKAIELNPNDVTYCNRGEALLHIKEWEKAKKDLTIAKDMGYDIIDSFHNDYESVTDFEEKTGIQLPEDIAAMLTQ